MDDDKIDLTEFIQQDLDRQGEAITDEPMDLETIVKGRSPERRGRHRASFTVTVTVDGETKIFDVDMATDADVWDVAKGMFQGLTDDVDRWLRQSGKTMRGGL